MATEAGRHGVAVESTSAGAVIRTSRLTLRPSSVEDAEAALRIYGEREVARWLSPAMDVVTDVATMREVLDGWSNQESAAPVGRWAVEVSETAELVGGVALLPLPPVGEDLEIGLQLAPQSWGRGLAAEAGHAIAHHAFATGVEELFAVVREQNGRAAATAKRVGMEWVGETDKYYDLHLQVFRLRKGDLDVAHRLLG